ncbi:MAG: hypothetical protein ACHRHE_06075 [Tepidisphaerales bacterium]
MREHESLAVIANMGRTGAQWFLGDVNCDGVVDAGDFAEVSAHLGDRVAAALGDSADEGVGGTLAVMAEPVAAKSQGFKSSKVQESKGAAKPKAKAVVKAKNGRLKSSRVQKLKGSRV